MNNELRHYGVLGMKWGVRRYQNKDGSLTPAGQKRYGKGGTARYTSWSTKRRRTAAESDFEDAEISRKQGFENEARYFEKSGRRESRRADASQKFDDKYASYAKKTSVGKAIVGNLLAGPFRYKTYAMARTAGESRGKAAIRAIFDIGLGVLPVLPQGVSLQRHAIREKYIDTQTRGKVKESNNSSMFKNRQNKTKETARDKFRQYKQFNQQLNESANEYKQATKNMSRSEKKQLQKNRNEYMKIYMEANNNVAAKLNPKVEAFNAKWAKEFEGYDDWSKSPKYAAYEKAFADQYNEAMEKEMERLYKSKYGK